MAKVRLQLNMEVVILTQRISMLRQLLAAILVAVLIWVTGCGTKESKPEPMAAPSGQSIPQNEEVKGKDAGEKAAPEVNPAQETKIFLSTVLMYLEGARDRAVQVIDLIPEVNAGAIPVSSFVNQVRKAETDIKDMQRLMATDLASLKGKLGKDYPGEIEEISSVASRALAGYANGLAKMREAAAWPSKEAWDDVTKAFAEATVLYNQAGERIEKHQQK